MSTSESDSDSSGWTLLSREGLDEGCVGAEWSRRRGPCGGPQGDGAKTAPRGAALGGFLEGKLREASGAGGEGPEGVGEPGVPDEATCTVEPPARPEEVKEEVNEIAEEVGSKTSEPMDKVLKRVEEEGANVSEEVKMSEEVRDEIDEARDEVGGNMREEVSDEMEEVSGEVRRGLSEKASEMVREAVSEEVGEEFSGEERGEVSEGVGGEVMEEVEVRREVSMEVMKEVCGEVNQEVTREVSRSDNNDLFALDPSALDDVPGPRASPEAPVEMPDSAVPSPSAGLQDPPAPRSSHPKASAEPGTRAGSEDALVGSSSIRGCFPFPLGRERAPSGAGSSTDEDQEKLGRCDDDEIRSGPMVPRLRRRLARRQLPTALADGTAPGTGGTVPGTDASLTVLVPALALIVVLGLVVASNHVASGRQRALVQENERLGTTERQLQAEGIAMARRWEAERGALSQENAALRATLAQLRQEAGRSTAAAKQEGPGAATAQGQEAARAAARELAAEGRRLQAEVRRLHRELREERAASATTRGERDAAAVALEAEGRRSHLWERLYVEARDAAAEHGKRKQEEGEVRGPDPRHRLYEDAKNSTRKRAERGAGQAESDASRSRGWGGHATAGAGSEARAEARQGDGRRGQGQGQGQGQGSRRRGEERLKMKGRDWRGPEEYGAQRAHPPQGQGHSTKHNEQHNRCHEQHKQQSYRAWHGKPRRHCDLHVAEVDIELGPLPFGPKC
ncbi:uncharacterized protein LOC133355064 [Lethenteron reissneri]|uniref:uncharacterized protein LOC133355064 n=1 Tax=Lethenteron reissneri TaxID=7753 RepID=UPI002AB799CC|nr:uncharacterized protein LOC133355064 [Lethenteron reissneri]